MRGAWRSAIREHRGGGTTFRRSWVLSDIKTAREGPEFRRGRPVLQSPLRLWKLYDVIPEIDIWRAATLMPKRYGKRALEESATPADELASAGCARGGAPPCGHGSPENRRRRGVGTCFLRFLVILC
jgi:hypothetical protein